jgi:diguanylate cyclase (GGDEF)-like protein
MEAVHAMMEMSRAQESSVSIFFVDVDNFKRLNDTFGHRIGDEVLLRIAETLQRTVSTNGVVGRYGGEEFVIAVANRSPEETQQLAEAVVRAVEQVSVAEIGLSEPVTCSLGAIRATNVARLAEAGLVHAADELMYTAKRGGKNRACFRALGKDGALDVIRSCGAESNSPQTGDPRRG